MKKIMFAVPEHADEFVRAANLKDEGITKLDLGGNLIRGYVSELAEALKDTGVEELNMTRTGISEGESIEFVDAIVRGVGIEKLAIDHSETPAFTQKIVELEHEKSLVVDETLQGIVRHSTLRLSEFNWCLWWGDWNLPRGFFPAFPPVSWKA